MNHGTIVDKLNGMSPEEISKSATLSFYYAANFLHKRFEQGEEIISENDYYSYQYSVHVIKEKLPDWWHNKMLCRYLIDPNNTYLKMYFDFVKEKCTFFHCR